MLALQNYKINVGTRFVNENNQVLTMWTFVKTNIAIN